MRLGNFESAGLEPLGTGDDKEVFINQLDSGKVISVLKEGNEDEKNTPRMLKGAFYLTKIAHLLLPQHIPDIYQAGESATGQQTFDRERVAHTVGHSELQAARNAGHDETEAKGHMIEEMGKEVTLVDEKLSEIGFGFNIDANMGNYSRDKDDSVRYLETFTPWEVSSLQGNTLELLFDEEDMRKAIGQLEDPETQRTCETYLSRLLALFEEEKKALEEKGSTNISESETEIRQLETLFDTFESTCDLDVLKALETEEEARNSPERAAANIALGPIASLLGRLSNENKVTPEQYDLLNERYRKIARAVGSINRGRVDHTR